MSPEDKWPAVNKAYDFVIPSYQLMSTRFESADARLTNLVTISCTLTLAVPIFAKTVEPNVSFASPFFVLGMLAFLVGAVVGICGRVTGSIALPDPMILYEKNLHDSEWEFKKNQIYFAGENFDYNVQAVRKKGNVAIGISVAILVEALLFVGWMVS